MNQLHPASPSEHYFFKSDAISNTDCKTRGRGRVSVGNEGVSTRSEFGVKRLLLIWRLIFGL
jgi:hypothetical protein